MASPTKTSKTKRRHKKAVGSQVRGKRSAAKLRKMKREGAILIVG